MPISRKTAKRATLKAQIGKENAEYDLKQKRKQVDSMVGGKKRMGIAKTQARRAATKNTRKRK
jgi:hypothetical protein